MAMPIIQPNAVGFYVIIRPTISWVSAFIDRGYEELGAKIVRETGASIDDLLQTSVEIIIRTTEQGVDPAIRGLPLEHPTRQDVLNTHRVGAATFAYLQESRFFVLVYKDGQCRFQNVQANTIREAQRKISQRPDVRAIDRQAVVSWQPTTVH